MKEKRKHHGRRKSSWDKAKTDLFVNFDAAPFQYQESINSLRTNLKFVSINNEYKKLIVTSSIPNEGKTNISINLAASLASSGNVVLVIDCDLRKPMLHRYLKLNLKEKGLVDLLSEPGEIQDSTFHRIQDGLYALTAGGIPMNPTEILGSAVMGELLDALKLQFDYIILDTAPVSIVTDAAVLSQYADGVIMVVRQKMVTFEQARRAKKNLEAVNANILGAVLNDFDTRYLDKESGYYYSYYYNYSYSDKEQSAKPIKPVKPEEKL